MAVRVRLDRMLARRRMSPAELSDRVGVTVENLEVLKSGRARAIRFATLDALCRELACTPGDLLEHAPFEEETPFDPAGDPAEDPAVDPRG